jgi:hypothetical protein
MMNRVFRTGSISATASPVPTALLSPRMSTSVNQAIAITLSWRSRELAAMKSATASLTALKSTHSRLASRCSCCGRHLRGKTVVCALGLGNLDPEPFRRYHSPPFTTVYCRLATSPFAQIGRHISIGGRQWIPTNTSRRWVQIWVCPARCGYSTPILAHAHIAGVHINRYFTEYLLGPGAAGKRGPNGL